LCMGNSIIEWSQARRTQKVFPAARPLADRTLANMGGRQRVAIAPPPTWRARAPSGRQKWLKNGSPIFGSPQTCASGSLAACPTMNCSLPVRMKR
jgi:hypothetical protein